MKDNTTKHLITIKEICGPDVQVFRPALPGFIHPVYIVEDGKDKTVFRFSSPQRAHRNVVVSNVLLKHGFNVPRVSVKHANGEYCETYPFMHGKTLYERATEGISPESVHKILKQLFDIMIEMTKIHPGEINADFDGYAERNLKIVHKYFQFMNMAPKQICHDDLHDKNFLLDNNDNICAILDLDAVKECSLAYSVVRMMTFAEPYGYTIGDIKQFLPNMYKGRFFNVSHQLKIYECLRAIYHQAQNLMGTRQTLANRGKTM